VYVILVSDSECVASHSQRFLRYKILTVQISVSNCTACRECICELSLSVCSSVLCTLFATMHCAQSNCTKPYNTAHRLCLQCTFLNCLYVCLAQMLQDNVLWMIKVLICSIKCLVPCNLTLTYRSNWCKHQTVCVCMCGCVPIDKLQ
jgi:hypothetical protein